MALSGRLAGKRDVQKALPRGRGFAVGIFLACASAGAALGAWAKGHPGAARHPWAALAGALHGQPKITCDNPLVDVGTHEGGDTASAEFILRNAGNAPLTLGRVRPGCGCTTATLEAGGSVIPPNGTRKLYAVLSTKYQTGARKVRVVVESDDPNNHEFSVAMSVVVTPAVKMERTSIDFGEVKSARGATIETEIGALEGSGHDFQVTNVVSGDPDRVAVKCDPIEPGRRYRLTVSVVPHAERGAVKSFIQVYTDNQRFDMVGLPVSAAISN